MMSCQEWHRSRFFSDKKQLPQTIWLMRPCFANYIFITTRFNYRCSLSRRLSYSDIRRVMIICSLMERVPKELWTIEWHPNDINMKQEISLSSMNSRSLRSSEWWQWCWWHRDKTCYSYNQHILSPTSVTNINATVQNNAYFLSKVFDIN